MHVVDKQQPTFAMGWFVKPTFLPLHATVHVFLQLTRPGINRKMHFNRTCVTMVVFQRQHDTVGQGRFPGPRRAPKQHRAPSLQQPLCPKFNANRFSRGDKDGPPFSTVFGPMGRGVRITRDGTVRGTRGWSGVGRLARPWSCPSGPR